MKNFKNILLLALVGVMVGMGVFASTKTTHQANCATNQFKKTFQYSSTERDFSVSLLYSTYTELHGDVEITMTAETNKETLKKFEKYCKKKIDAASIGEVFYVTTTATNPVDQEELNGQYTFKVKLKKFYKNKDLAVIPFNDYRSPQSLKAVTVENDGSISFIGNKNAYAYAIVYNGAYKDLILIGILLLTVLIICVLVKIYCLRKDNPIYKEKKKQKAIKTKKEIHKENRKLAQELKRERDKIKRKK